ncbi:MAG: hypothetical protein LBC10_00340, partial [Deltaproteobacteria bacterium]|nr:hypothetical protein [Deltaproteobacteria bacterium]
MDPVAEVLFKYLRDVIYHQERAALDIARLPSGFRDFGEGLQYFAEGFLDARQFAKALSRGELDARLSSAHNDLAAPLLTLQASLRHLAWQIQQVATGDYQQRPDFMGIFSAAISTMVQRLEAHRKIIEASDKAKSKFLATVSHEIRTPMNAILGLTEIQLLDETLSKDTRDAFGRIYAAGYTLLGIINDLLDLSRMEAGKVELMPARYEIASLITDAVQMNMMRIGDKPIEFRLQVNEDIPSVLFGDELRIKQILNNLLSNAFKYTQAGEVVLAVSVVRGSGAESGDVTLVCRVSDTGSGMTEEQVNRLFEEYSRFYLEANRLIEGIGLGMNITRQLVQMMGGVILVDSEPGKGSV